MDIKKQIQKLTPELVKIRRDFHQHPELGRKEHRTAARVEQFLRDLGVDVRRVVDTGVVGVLRGRRSGPGLLIRADLDALPIREETDLPFRSENKGVMHACGHDGHTAALLTAAKVLVDMKDQIPGNIIFAFEPDEENTGALDMIREGVLDDPPIDACFGLHFWPGLNTGRIAVGEGPIMAGMAHFDLVVTGRGGHTGAPHQAVDPIIAAAGVIQGVQFIQTRRMDPLKPTSIIFGTVKGGSVSNAVADCVEMTGTVRYLIESDPADPDHPIQFMKRTVADICAQYGVGHELTFPTSQPTLVNNADMAELVRSVAAEILGGPENVSPLVTMAGEDFAEFSARKPGTFYFIGAGNPERGTVWPLHHPRFSLDEDALPIAVEMHVLTALRYLGCNQPGGPFGPLNPMRGMDDDD